MDLGTYMLPGATTAVERSHKIFLKHLTQLIRLLLSFNLITVDLSSVPPPSVSRSATQILAKTDVAGRQVCFFGWLVRLLNQWVG